MVEPDRNPKESSILQTWVIFLLLIWLTVSLLLGILLYWNYQEVTRSRVEAISIQQKASVVAAAASLRSELKRKKADIRYLAAQRSVENYLTNLSANSRSFAISDMIAFIKSDHYFYHQAILLAEDGEELIRINSTETGIVQLADKPLPNKVQPDYLQAALQLAEDEVYVSPISLNLEHGTIEIPERPTLSFVLRTGVDKIGRNILLVLNFNAAELLENIENISSLLQTPLWLVNQDGYWLKASNSIEEWGFMISEREQARLQIRHPILWKTLTDGKPVDDNSLLQYEEIDPVASVNNTPAEQYLPGKKLYLLSYLDEDTLARELHQEKAAFIQRILFAMSLWTLLALLAFASEKYRRRTVNIERRIRRKQQQKYLMQIQRSNRELEHFAYVASHDLQEPLRVISGYLQLIERRYSKLLDDNGREFIDYAVEGSKRLQDLIQDLLQYSRLSTEAKPLTEVDLNNTLIIIQQDLQRLIQESGAVIRVGELPTIKADSSQISLLLRNLLSNAIKFAHPDRAPEVTISADRTKSSWKLSVTDNGVGIEHKYHQRIFKMFQRLHTREEYSGNGIGLAICLKIAQRHGGNIDIQSEPGKGTKFIVKLAYEPPHDNHGDTND